MSINIDLSDVVGPNEAACTQLRVSLPGGMSVQGVVPKLGASPLEASRATIAAANSALAPLGPLFAILDALLAVVDFAKSVPDVVTNPPKVVQAVKDVVKKASKLASLVPQLSVPLMIVGIIDVVIAMLRGIQAEVAALVVIEERLEAVLGLSGDVPALAPIAANVQLQLNARRAQISCGMGDVEPLLAVISQLAQLIGLPPITVSADPDAGSLADLNDALEAAVSALTAFRSKVPLP